MKTRTSTANIDADLIARLPDALLIQIVSLLPAADANRTRILSKRWNNIWPLLPNLCFVTPKSQSTKELNRFRHSVDQTLAVRGAMPFQRLLFTCDYDFHSDTIYDCVRKVLLCKSQELELRFPSNGYLRVRFSLDLLKTCSSVVSLTLRGVMVFDIPDAELLFPCLKKIVLDSVTYSNVKCFANLISGSPVLEELVLEKYHHISYGDFTEDKTVMVSSPSLKRLSFAKLDSWRGYKVVIDAPKVEYFNIQDLMDTEYYFMTKPLSVTEAHIKIYHRAKSVAELVTCISCVKILTLGASTILALGKDDVLNLPVFPNLVKFVVGLDWKVDGSWSKLPSLLNKMPNLEHITFADGLIPCFALAMNWHPREEVPACLQYKIKEIIIKNHQTITQQEFDLIRYLLKHSIKLETLTMNAHKIDEGRREQVLNFHRGSKSCRVEFV